MALISFSKLEGVIFENQRANSAQTLTKLRYLIFLELVVGANSCLTSSLTMMSCSPSSRLPFASLMRSAEKSGSLSIFLRRIARDVSALSIELKYSRTAFSPSGWNGCSFICSFLMAKLAIFSSCAQLARMASFSASSPLAFLKITIRLFSIMLLIRRSIAPIIEDFYFSRVCFICFRRATIVSSFISGGALVIAIPMLFSRRSSVRHSRRNRSRKFRSAFFQGMILVRVDFSSMKMRKPTLLLRSTSISVVNFCSNSPHFLFSGGQINEGTSTSFSYYLSLRDFSYKAGQPVWILMDLFEMTPSKLYLPLSQASPGVGAPCTYLWINSAKVVLPVWLGPIRRID